MALRCSGTNKSVVLLVVAWVMALLSSCSGQDTGEVDRLNEKAYSFHYRDLDSTQHYAQLSYALADSFGVDASESLNHLAFVYMAQMKYDMAEKLLNAIQESSDNQIELLISDIQLMRLCQRRSRNKEFYGYHEQAERRLRRIASESDILSLHQQKRLVYAQSEFYIVASSYYYYVGLTKLSIDALESIDPAGGIQQDTAQLLSYWYNIGAGGVIDDGTPEEIAQAEFGYLMRCYSAASAYNYVFWKAQSLQALSEHLQKPEQRNMLIRNNLTDIELIDEDNMPDSLLAGNMAQRAYDLFRRYGDVYQVAGANRTLAECFWYIKDYRSALVCLRRAIYTNKDIAQAPDLVASIREQLSLVYSAVDDKVNSDYNRNLYLDLQEQTRQDRLLEARAAQLDESSHQLNLMLMAVIMMIVAVIGLLYVFDFMRRRSDARYALDSLLVPLQQWKERNEIEMGSLKERYDELQEESGVVQLHLQQNRRRNIEQRAKIQLVNGIMPFIDRIVHEVGRLQKGGEGEEMRQQRYQYIAELTDSIIGHNDVLTQWIQMRQGEVSLKIESFALQPLFDIVARGRMSYKIKEIELVVESTPLVVKADKTLTLFMINTMADNARKFTTAGGQVTVRATEQEAYVEVSVADTGCGMTEEQMSHVFDRTYTGGHGFGLKNCHGIMEKYKKISKIFSGCTIGVESEVGQGTRFFFRLPKGVQRTALMLVAVVTSLLSLFMSSVPAEAQTRRHTSSKLTSTMLHMKRDLHSKASRYADSAYFANINGQYAATLRYADSCRRYLAPTDTAILLDISNESAVAALALHRWDVYEKNNGIYTRLFHEASADSSLPEYVSQMKKSETNKNVAVILLVLLLAIIFPAYYFLYYRYRLNYRYCIDRINAMNKLLLNDLPTQEKLRGIERLDDFEKYSVSDDQQERLRDIVAQIRTTLQRSIDNVSVQETSIELAEDELRHLQMDNYQLHVSNSVLDNCLSTLKHETMYYPSRIRQLIDGYDDDEHLEGIAELAGYYKELYGILSLQAVRQISPMRPDRDVTIYLFELLKKLNQGFAPVCAAVKIEGKYTVVEVMMDHCRMSGTACAQLFTPETSDLNFMVCRQIVREMGEATNLRGSGMTASCSDEGYVRIVVTMPQRCWKLVSDDRRMERLLAVGDMKE